jgi:anti-sigma-K factor RskA
MNWYMHPQTTEALAASYVMGNMSARTRRRFEQVMAQRPDVAQAVSQWAERAMPVALSLPPQPLSSRSWTRLADTLRLGESSTLPPSPKHWWQRLFAPGSAGALAMGLVLGLSLPIAWQYVQTSRTEMQLPESYVGVLGTQQGKPGLIVSSLRRGTVVDLKVVTPVPVPAGHHLHLWRIDKDGVPTALGVLPAAIPGNILHMSLSQPAEDAFFPAVELAVSIEPDARPPGQPAQPFVYRGLCGKVWK